MPMMMVPPQAASEATRAYEASLADMGQGGVRQTSQSDNAGGGSMGVDAQSPTPSWRPLPQRNTTSETVPVLESNASS